MASAAGSKGAKTKRRTPALVDTGWSRFQGAPHEKDPGRLEFRK